jgi:hypothetical protein
VQGARIIDLAPTLLHLLGVAVPGDMDGRVLQDILTDAYAGEVATQAAPTAVAVEGAYSAEDEALISDRLKSLGYIE